MIRTKEITPTFEDVKAPHGNMTYNKMTKSLDENINDFLAENHIVRENFIDIKYSTTESWEENTALVIYCT